MPWNTESLYLIGKKMTTFKTSQVLRQKNKQETNRRPLKVKPPKPLQADWGLMYHKLDLHGKGSDSVWHCPVNSTYIKGTVHNCDRVSCRFPWPRGPAVLPAVLLDSVCFPLSRLQPAHSGKLHLSPQLSLAPTVLRLQGECWSVEGLRDVSIVSVCCVCQTSVCIVALLLPHCEKWPSVYFLMRYGCSSYRFILRKSKGGSRNVIIISIQGTLPCTGMCR